MTQFLTIALSKKVIFDKIGLFTSYLAGKRSEDYVAYDRVAVRDLDLPLLDYIADDAAMLLASKLGDAVAEFSIESDVMRFVVRNPAYAAEAGNDISTPDSGLLLGLMESCVVADTIIRWLQIVGYEFGQGATQALSAATEVSATKIALLTSALTPPVPATPEESPAWTPTILKARRRAIPPM